MNCLQLFGLLLGIFRLVLVVERFRADLQLLKERLLGSLTNYFFVLDCLFGEFVTRLHRTVISVVNFNII